MTNYIKQKAKKKEEVESFSPFSEMDFFRLYTFTKSLYHFPFGLTLDVLDYLIISISSLLFIIPPLLLLPPFHIVHLLSPSTCGL